MTIQIHSFSNSEFNFASDSSEWNHGDTSGLSGSNSGLVVGVSIFGNETVTSISSGGKAFAFVRADTNGSYRSEIWYCTNIPISALTTVTVSLSASTNFVMGACCYLYFGGVGAHVGATGTTNNAEISITPTQLNSITFANFCISALGGAQSGGTHYDRWNINSDENYAIGVDEGPWDLLDPVVLEFLNVGAEDIWALSAVELLDYQDNPPAIMGL